MLKNIRLIQKWWKMTYKFDLAYDKAVSHMNQKLRPQFSSS